MVTIQESAPSASLCDFVRKYVQRDFSLGGKAPLLRPIWARCSPIIDFLLNGDLSLRFPDGREIPTTGSPIIVRPQTYRRVTLVVRAVQIFTIYFQPSGPYRLFGLPLSELNENGEQPRAVLGRSMSCLEEQLRECTTFGQRVRAVDRLLLNRLDISRRGDAVSTAANALYSKKGRISIDKLAADAGLSLRQFERRFVHQIGMRPKLYARIARFEGVLEERVRSPHKSWACLAQDLGYYDQMHLVHEFRGLSGAPPTKMDMPGGLGEMIGLESFGDPATAQSAPSTVSYAHSRRLIL